MRPVVSTKRGCGINGIEVQKFRERTSLRDMPKHRIGNHASATAMVGATCRGGETRRRRARPKLNTRESKVIADREAEVIWKFLHSQPLPHMHPAASSSLAAVAGRENVPDDCDGTGDLPGK